LNPHVVEAAERHELQKTDIFSEQTIRTAFGAFAWPSLTDIGVLWIKEFFGASSAARNLMKIQGVGESPSTDGEVATSPGPAVHKRSEQPSMQPEGRTIFLRVTHSLEV
jgi:hypothetical protein